MAKDMKIGEIREYNERQHICVMDVSGCSGCSYQRKEGKFCEEVIPKYLGQCAGRDREDGEDVVFIILAD